MESRNTQARKPHLPALEGFQPVLVLSVDDDRAQLELQREILEVNGYIVISCTDCRRALEVFRTMPVGLVVLDYSMPEMNGAELARAMRIQRPNVPIILLSDYSQLPDDVINAVDAYLVKSQSPRALLQEIWNLIAQKSIRRSA